MSKDADDKSSSVPIPDSYICPITQTMMRDPYIDGDGNSYEKEAIMNWVSSNPVSPITRNSLQLYQLVPNRVLKDIIHDFRCANGMDDAKDDAKGTTADAKSAVQSKSVPLDRRPLMLFTLIDVSGSMGTPCGQNANGESDGYSRMDLVKHTLNTIITSLSEHDKIAIIKFSTVAELFSQLTFCTEENKRNLTERVKHIYQDGQTNIWDALRLTIDLISGQGAYANDFNIEVYLLTDGEPNINPPGPIVDTLKTYMRVKLKDNFKPKISTFGYGYALDSSMLFDLSTAANGVFGFIPDSTMVGTVFINALSQSLVGNHTDYSSSPADELSDAKEVGDAITNGPVDMFGDIVKKTINMLEEINATRARDAPNPAIVVEFLSWTTNLKAELEASDNAADAKSIQLLSDLVLDCSDSDDANLGQIMKATQPDFFKKWGKHYILSVTTAFKKRTCINFKDKAMQNFRSDKFKTEQQRVEEVFIQLPPPAPSIVDQTDMYTRRGYGINGPPSSSAPASAPVSMTSYYNQGGGCFTGESIVFVLNADEEDVNDARAIQVADLRKGMRVVTADAGNRNGAVSVKMSVSKVSCLVKLKYSGSLHRVGSMTLTPYHPVLIGGVAHFPVDLQASSEKGEVLDAGWVYDLVLENRCLVASSSNSSPDADFKDSSALFAATFGHNCRLDKFQHDYFGSELVVSDIANADPVGWQAGLVILSEYTFDRHPETCLVRQLVACV